MNLRVTCGHNWHGTIAKYDETTVSADWCCRRCGNGVMMNAHTTIRVREVLARHLELAPGNVVSINTLRELINQ